MIKIVAHSEAMREAVRLAERVASTDANVLVTGESGVGKDAIAFYVHSKSNRATHSFLFELLRQARETNDTPARVFRLTWIE